MTAPDEKHARAARQVVQKLGGKELDALIDRELGKPMLGVMKAVARAQLGDDENAVARAVHLLAFGYLLRREVEKK